MRTSTATIIAAIGIPVAIAQAGPVLFGFEGVGRGRNINISSAGEESRVFAGSVMHSVDGALLSTYCIEPDQNAQLGVANFERVTLAGGLLIRSEAAAKSNLLAELADIAGESIWTTSADRTLAAAFQVATWEIVSDFDSSLGAASFDFSAGDFRGWGNDSVFKTAAGLLSQLQFNRADASGYNAYLNDTAQDFMSLEVPAPGVFALAVVGIPTVLSRRRRR